MYVEDFIKIVSGCPSFKLVIPNKTHIGEFEIAQKPYKVSSWDLSYNSQNLNLKVKLDGKVKLKESLASIGDEKDTICFYNHSVIRFGVGIIMDCYIDSNTLQSLEDGGLDISVHGELGGGVVDASIDLSKIQMVTPVIGDLSPDEIAELVMNEIKLKSFIKVLEYRFHNTDKFVYEPYSEDIEKVLEEHGIKKGVYDPNFKYKSKGDQIKVKVSGFSSLPSYNAYLKRLSEDKKPTANMKYLELYHNLVKKGMDSADEPNDYIEEKLKEAKSSLEYTQNLLMKIKYEIIGNKCTTMNDLSAGDTKISFVLSEDLLVD